MTVQTIDPSQPIIITDSARQYFSEYVSAQDAVGIKLALKGGGCAGFSYEWTLITDTDQQAEPYVQQYDDFMFVLAENSHQFLVGSTIDLEDLGIKGTQIIVNSPKQASACGCGESVTFDV